MKEFKEQESRLLLYAMYTILYINDTACFSVQQFSIKTNDKDKESKKIFGALTKRCSNYIKQLSAIMGSSIDGYCDYCTIMDERCDKLFYDFKNAITKTYKDANIDDYEYCSEVETMRSMLSLAVEIGDTIIKKASSYVKEADNLRGYLLNDALRVANNFANWSYRKVPNSVDLKLNSDSDVIVKLNKLSETLTDYSIFEEAYNTSIEMSIKRNNNELFA
jgi:hypothetical protein